LNDFDFEKPRANLKVDTAITRSHDQSKHLRSDYPGAYTTTAQGTAYARVRLESLHTADQCASARSHARRLTTGGLIKLTEHPHAERNREYLIAGAEYTLHAGGYDSGGGGAAEFACQFTAAPSQQPYRSPQITPRPVVHGPHTAFVVGKKGEEIWTDKYGRVKVQFHWDQLGKKDENSSCWLRVMQPWAGKKWGAVFLPRIGHEVVVSFLEGDPDRPLIVGSVYNEDNMPPNALPDQQNKSSIKSNTTKGGGGFNELTLDDTKDKEEFFLHAQNNFRRVVRNNDTLEVGLEKKDKGDQTVKIHHDQVIEIGNDGKLTIKKNRTTDVQENDTETIGKEQKVKTGTDMSVDVGAAYTLKVKTTALIEANSSIELKVGASSIKIEPGKITLSAPQIAVDAKGQAEIKSGGVMEVKASGPLSVGGAIVKIN
ncbi:MAG TPA: type VI secretion system tip protein TssI/VgrG, partial [Burkholderiaceae bacterium]|nr:type VI secretion system tip protein TssI/VgrG [Burkholderiaceae bacterium]